MNGETVLRYEKPQIGGGAVAGYDPAVKKDGELLDVRLDLAPGREPPVRVPQGGAAESRGLHATRRPGTTSRTSRRTTRPPASTSSGRLATPRGRLLGRRKRRLPAEQADDLQLVVRVAAIAAAQPQQQLGPVLRPRNDRPEVVGGRVARQRRPAPAEAARPPSRPGRSPSAACRRRRSRAARRSPGRRPSRRRRGSGRPARARCRPCSRPLPA